MTHPLEGRRIGPYELGACWAPAVWARSIALATRDSIASSPSKSCRARRTVAYVSPFSLAVCASTLGDHDGAMRFCEDAIEEHDMLFALFHNWLPDFADVRADPRFADILTRFNARRRA